jgi:cytochrome c553
MNKSRLKLSLMLISLITLNGAYAGKNEFNSDVVEAGRIVSTKCAICHGTEGEGNGSPNSKIAGMDADTFIKHLHDFQSGARKNVMMQRFVNMLTEKDIVNVAAYYATK